MFNSRDTSTSDNNSSANDENTDSVDDLNNCNFKSRNLNFLIINCCLGSFLVGYCLTLSNLTFQVIWENDTGNSIAHYLYNSLFTSMVPFGGSIGCLIVISKVFQFRRRVVLVLADLIAIIGSSLCMIDGQYFALSGMFIIGLAVGVNSIMIPTYLMEYAPCYMGKGRVIITHYFFFIFGISASFLWGLFITREKTHSSQTYQVDIENPIKHLELYKKFIFIAPLVLAVLRAVILGFYYKQDTPFFYLLKNRKEKARLIICQYYNPELCERFIELFEIKLARQMEGSTKFIDMFQLRYRKRVGISCLMNFFCYFSGAFFILFYSKEALDKLDDRINEKSNQIRTLIIGAVLLFTQFFQILFARALGRKTLLLIGQALYIIGFIGLSIVINFRFINYLDVITIFYSIICIGFGFQSSVIPVTLNEILPERGVAAAHFIALFSIFVGAFAYHYLLKKQLIFYSISAGFCLLGFILLSYFVKETKGLTNYQIEKLYTQNFHGLINEPDESDQDINKNLIPQKI